MATELTALSVLALVHFASIFIAQRFLTRDIGVEGNMGTRDNLEARLSPLTLRLRRANANLTENIAPFIIAVLVVVLAGKTGWLTATLVWVFVLARIAYVPAYACGWMPWRSLIWLIGAGATLLLLLLGLI